MCESKPSIEKLQKLDSVLDIQTKGEKFKVFVGSVLTAGEDGEVRQGSIPDSRGPRHILDKYSTNRKEDNLGSVTDCGASSEAEDLNESKAIITNDDTCYHGSTKNMINLKNYEINWKSKIDMYASTDTAPWEHNAQFELTDCMKKAFKKPLPPGPPPKKPPRTFEVPSTASSFTLNEIKKSLSEISLNRQISDPGQKLIRKNARKYIRDVNIHASYKRSGSCVSYNQLKDVSSKALPTGPPPKKPPRTIAVPSDEYVKSKKDPKQMLEKMFSFNFWRDKLTDGMCIEEY